MSQQNVWPVKGYQVVFNPRTHEGGVGLNLDNNPANDVKFENLTADDITAILAILKSGAEYYKNSGSIGVKG